MDSRTRPALITALWAEAHKALTFPPIPATVIGAALLIGAAGMWGLNQWSAFTAGGADSGTIVMAPTAWILMILHYGQVAPILIGAWIIGQDLPLGPRRTAQLAAGRATQLFAKLVVTFVVALCAALLSVLAGVLSLSSAKEATGGVEPGYDPYPHLIAYWVVIAVVSAALTITTRSIAGAVVPLLVWTIGLSDLVAARLPIATHAFDQILKGAHAGGGAVPELGELLIAAAQVLAFLILAAALHLRRDCG